MRIVNLAAFALLLIGGINWALIGLVSIDLVELLLGPATLAARILYAVLGLGALYCAFLLKGSICCCKSCPSKGESAS